MDFADKKILEIANYAKGWYGTFTGAGEIAFKELAVIFGHLCLMEPKYIDRKQLFIEVERAFRTLASRRDPDNNWMYRELFTEVFYPNWPNLQPDKDDAPDVKMLNKMLRIIAQVEVKFFAGGEMVMDANIARLLPDADHHIARRKELGFLIENA